MSTAGKVLVVLVMLMTIVWMILSAGVSRLNTNANTRLHDLTVEVEKLQGEVNQTQEEVVSLLSQTSQQQEKIDREYTLLRSQQADLQRASSQINETLSGVKYQLELVQETVKSAQAALEHRDTEQQDETKELTQRRSLVQELMAKSSELRKQLAEVRKDVQSNYHANIEMLGKTAKTTEAQPGSAN